MTLEVRVSRANPDVVAIQRDRAPIPVRRSELCELVEQLLPHADAECDDLVDRILKALLPHITRQLREDGWLPRRNYPCGCFPRGLCAEHREIRWGDHAERTGH